MTTTPTPAPAAACPDCDGTGRGDRYQPCPACRPQAYAEFLTALAVDSDPDTTWTIR
jgi:hypothetical protein